MLTHVPAVAALFISKTITLAAKQLLNYSEEIIRIAVVPQIRGCICSDGGLCEGNDAEGTGPT
jgi:hypothetical protein